MNRFAITKHAAKRWIERNCFASPIEAKSSFYSAISQAKEVRLKRERRAKALLDHNFKPTRYFQYDRWIFVVTDGVIVTVHDNKANRFQQI